jgi:hypothetical protein
MPTLPGRRGPMSIFLGAVITSAIAATLHGELIPVRHPQGSAHGFLVLKTIEGTPIATGDVTQVIHGDRVTSRVTFHSAMVQLMTTLPSFPNAILPLDQ